MLKLTKRTAVVAVPVAVLSIAGVALAASLTVSTGSLGAGSKDVAACGTAKVNYTSVYVPAQARYELKEIIVSSTDSACASAAYRVVVTSTGGALLGSEADHSGLLSSGLDTITVSSEHIPVADVDKVTATFTTPASSSRPPPGRWAVPVSGTARSWPSFEGVTP